LDAKITPQGVIIASDFTKPAAERDLGFRPGAEFSARPTRAVVVTATRSCLAIGPNSLSAFCFHKGGCRACRQDRHIGIDLKG
jgi:hypothetical protein